jgi:hypothetical protein
MAWQMNLSRNAPIVAAAAGLAIGPWLYGGTYEARQVGWFAYQVAFLLATLVIFVAIAAPVLMNQPSSARASYDSAFPGALFLVVSGVVGWLAATHRAEVEYPALFGLSMGLGALAGLRIGRHVFRDAFAT